MLKYFLLTLIGSAIAVTILEPRDIQLENGKIMTMKGVDSAELKNVEANIGCSVKCASACLTFSQGNAAIQCASQCGCNSLFSEKETGSEKTEDPNSPASLVQSGIENSFGIIEWLGITFAIAIICYLAYRKSNRIKSRSYQLNVHPVDEDAPGYVRL